MTKQTAATAIANAKVHAHKASMRSSADLCIATAEECFANGKLQYAFDWAVRSLGYSTTVFYAREMLLKRLGYRNVDKIPTTDKQTPFDLGRSLPDHERENLLAIAPGIVLRDVL